MCRTSQGLVAERPDPQSESEKESAGEETPLSTMIPAKEEGRVEEEVFPDLGKKAPPVARGQSFSEDSQGSSDSGSPRKGKGDKASRKMKTKKEGMPPQYGRGARPSSI